MIKSLGGLSWKRIIGPDFNREFDIKKISDENRFMASVRDTSIDGCLIPEKEWAVMYNIDSQKKEAEIGIRQGGEKELQEALNDLYSLYLTLPDAVICVSTDLRVKYVSVSVSKDGNYPKDYTSFNSEIADENFKYRQWYHSEIPNDSDVIRHYKELMEIDEVEAMNYIFKTECENKTFTCAGSIPGWTLHTSNIAFKWVNK